MIEYNYCNRDLLREPEKYQMSKYEGKEFLNSYTRIRKNIVKKLGLYNNEKFEKFISRMFIADKVPSELIETDRFLADLLLENIQRRNLECYNTELDRFIKKFEVKKRIYTKYDKDLKEITEDYFDLKNYILLSINCLIVYEKTANLKYLNTSLKLNDVVISNFENISDEQFKQLFSKILQKEMNCISELCLKKHI